MKTQENKDFRSVGAGFFVADIRVEPDSLRIFHDETAVKVESRVMQVLLYLSARPGEVVSREELEANVWAGRLFV